jgi:hypothetical protein
LTISFDTITNFFLPSSLIKLAGNFVKTEEEFDKVIYKDGSAEMQANLDLNGHRIINHGFPVDDNDLATLADVKSYTANIERGPAGLAANTFNTLASLKAADTSQFKTARLVNVSGVTDGLFDFKTDAAPYTADDLDIIKANDTALSVGAWVRQSAAGIAFIQTGTGSFRRPLLDKAREVVSINDYTGTTLQKIRSAVTELTSRGGGVLFIPKASYNLPSAELGGGIALTDNITVEGNGSTFTVTGVAQTGSIFVVVNVNNITIRNLRVYGNNLTSGYNNGNFLNVYLTSAGTADIKNFIVTDIYLENFQSPYWIFFQNDNASYRIKDIRIERISATSLEGNAFHPELLQYNSAVICVNALENKYIENVVVRDVTVEATHIKSGVIFYHGILNGRMEQITVKNAGLSAVFPDDKGAYAIQAYDSFWQGEGLVIRGVRVSGKSCGIYCAGGRDVTIEDFVCTNQTDTVTTSLPKGGVAINGTVNPTVRNGECRNCAIGVMIAGPLGYRCNGLIENVKVYENITNEGLYISPYPSYAMEGLTVRNCRFESSGNRACRVGTSPTQVLNDFVATNCYFKALGPYGFDQYANTLSTTSDNWLFERCTFIGTACGVRIRDMSGLLTFNLCYAPCTGAAQPYQIQNCTKLHMKDCEATAGSGSIGLALTNSTGTITGQMRVSAATLVQGLGAAEPTHTGVKGDFVNNVDFTLPSAGDGQTYIRGWRCLGSNNWRPVLETVNS